MQLDSFHKKKDQSVPGGHVIKYLSITVCAHHQICYEEYDV